jgi:hypothetical protein
VAQSGGLPDAGFANKQPYARAVKEPLEALA